jgi:dephospho-CoA kinase
MSTDSTKQRLSIGLTGGIASGKSTVADMFADMGATVIDTDLIARDVVKTGQPALDEIWENFGAEAFAADGSLDRKAMRSIIFSDQTKRHLLESILHPRIRQEAVNQAARAEGPYQIIVVPLLVESPLRAGMDRIIVVDCDEKVQLTRLLDRDAESRQQAQRIIDAQASRADRLAIADDVIQNNGDLENTRQQVEVLHSRYLAASSRDDAGQ